MKGRKERKMKKTLAILLSLALVICMIPATAFADITPVQLTATADTSSKLYNGSTGYALPTITITPPSGQDVPAEASFSWVGPDGQTCSTNSNVTGVGTYTATASTGDAYVITPSKFTFTINPVDFDAIDIAYTGPTLKSAFTGFDALANNAEVTSLPSDFNTGLSIKQGTIDVSSFATTTVTKADANKICITVKPTSADGKNIIGNGKFIYVSLTSSLTSEYKIWGTGTNGVIPDQTYNNGVALKPTIYVVPANATNASVRLTEGVDYKVTYSNNTEGGDIATVTVDGLGKYSGTLSTTFRVIGKSISNVSITGNNTIQGVKPTFTITDGTKTLVEGTDYTIVGYDSTTVGSSAGKATIEGKKNYSGTRQVTYTVISESNSFDSSDVVATGTTAVYYKKAVQHATPTIKVGSKTLTQGVDYSMVYTYLDTSGKTTTTTAPINAGVYTAKAVGKGNYAGEAYVGSFEIKAVPLDWAEIVLGSSTTLYNGVYVPTVTVRHISGGFYFDASDYKVEYKYVNSTSSYLKPTVVVTAVEGGNLTKTGSSKTELTKEFSLASRSLSNCTVTFTDSRTSKNYDGNASFKPPVTVKDYSLNRTLTENLDYKITYKDAAGKVVYALKDAGTYSVIVEGINAYTGTKTLTFTINGTDISGYTVTLKEASVNATGYAQTPVITSVKKGYYYSLTANDYTVSYQDSTGKTVTSMSAPGTYKVVVTGKNGYSGSTYATFRIVGLPQTVTVTQDSYKVYATSDSFKITAKASGDATGFTYTSSNPAVASVSSTGYVTMHKVGRAVITVTATGMKKYDPASTTVEVKVYPKKGYITKKPWTDGKKYQAKVRWTYQDGATSYQVRYSRDKNFGAKTYKTKTVKAHGKDYTTQSTTLKSLKSKSTYYIKVRAVYKDPVTGDTYYGAWSGWRSVKTK